RAPRLEEDEHDENRQKRALEQRLLDIVDRRLDARAGVLDDLHLRAGWQLLLQLLDALEDALADVGGREAECLLDVDADRRRRVVERGADRLFLAVLDVRDVAEPDDAIAVASDDELLE